MLKLFIVLSFFTFSVSSFGGECEKQFSDTIKIKSQELCPGGASQYSATGNYLIDDKYGFYVKCNDGGAFMGIMRVKIKKKSCTVKIEKTTRSEQLQ